MLFMFCLLSASSRYTSFLKQFPASSSKYLKSKAITLAKLPICCDIIVPSALKQQSELLPECSVSL